MSFRSIHRGETVLFSFSTIVVKGRIPEYTDLSLGFSSSPHFSPLTHKNKTKQAQGLVMSRSTYILCLYKINQLYRSAAVSLFMKTNKCCMTFTFSFFRITPRKFDMVPACNPQCSADATSDTGTHSNLTLSKRGTRTSFTFRKIRHEPCHCGEICAGAQ